MDLVFRDMDVFIKDTQILKKVSGVARRGDMLAVMGPSGAGKSTLLSALARRLPITSGMVTLNGELLNKHLGRKMRFVLQQDVFFPKLTLKQTLTFAALLTLPDKMPHSLKLQRVREIIEILELQKCADTVMGNAFILGLSGGERKRAAIACEILTDPDILLIDEPTSGLDYGIAYNLVETLQKYTTVGQKTIVASIHQPSSQMFHMFDNLLLLADGQVVYFGASSKVLDHFMSVGLQCKPHYNPADFMMEQLRISSDIKKTLIEESWRKRQETWPVEIQKEFAASDLDLYSKKSSRRQSSVSLFTGYTNTEFKKTPSHSSLGTITDQKNDYEHSKANEHAAPPKIERHMSLVDTDLQIGFYMETRKKWPTGFWTQYKVLTQRLMIHTSRNFFQPVTVIKSIFVCFLASVIWFQLDRTEEGLNDRLGAIFFICSFWGFDTIIAAASAFREENPVIMRERSAGTYRLSAYWLAKQTSELPIVVCMPALFVTIVYWAIGLNPSAWAFFSHVALLFIYIFVIQGIGLFIGVLFTSIRSVVTVSTVTMVCFFLLGGYFQRHFAKWISWLKYLSPLAYTFQAAMILELLHGPDLICLPSNTTAFEVCLTTSKRTVPGDDILKSFDVTMPIWFYYLILFLFFIASRYAVYLTLRYFRRPKTNK